jgi:hypothetical protein
VLVDHGVAVYHGRCTHQTEATLSDIRKMIVY